jgi:hypothetical protein
MHTLPMVEEWSQLMIKGLYDLEGFTALPVQSMGIGRRAAEELTLSRRQ